MMIIRQAQLNEDQFLADFTIESKAYWEFSAEYLEMCRPQFKMTKDYIENWPVKVLEDAGEILGYFSLKIIKNENRLDNIWIKPTRIRKGLGAVLQGQIQSRLGQNIYLPHMKYTIL